MTRVQAAPHGAGGGKHRKASPDLVEKAVSEASSNNRIKVILNMANKPTAQLRAVLARNGVQVHKHFEQLNALQLELPPSAVAELAELDEVTDLSLDREVKAFGGATVPPVDSHIATTTGSNGARVLNDAAGNNLDGRGVGVVVMDSGADASNFQFQNKQGLRIMTSVDFVNDGFGTADPYGHGSHVMGISSASDGNPGPTYSNKYAGVARKVDLVNLRVLNANGQGNVSAVLSAIDWVLAHPTVTFKEPITGGLTRTVPLKIVNISFGAVATTSYKNDPLCQAVRRLVNAGIVVVAAAGNDGKDINGNKIYGAIHAPGNDPSVITVGASNTKGTDTRTDDVVASYSSRGQTGQAECDLVHSSRRIGHADCRAAYAAINALYQECFRRDCDGNRQMEPGRANRPDFCIRREFDDQVSESIRTGLDSGRWADSGGRADSGGPNLAV